MRFLPLFYQECFDFIIYIYYYFLLNFILLPDRK